MHSIGCCHPQQVFNVFDGYSQNNRAKTTTAVQMNKSILLSVILSHAIIPFASATTIGFGAAPSSRSVVEGNLADVPVGSLVLVGTFTSPTFTLSGTTIQQEVTNAIADGGWTQFTASNLSTASVVGHQKVGGSLTDISAAADAFNGHSVYLWVFDTNQISTAQQMGIFAATSATPAWTFPTNNGGVGDGATLSTTTTATIAAIGGRGSVTSTQLILAAPVSAVPEPSTFTAGALLAFAAMGMRRRRRA